MIGVLHEFVLRTLGASATNGEGRVERGAPVDVVVRGRVDELSAKAVATAAQRGQTHDIVCLVPSETEVNDRMQVVVSDPPRLAGTYRIDSVRTTRKHLRILCTRTTIREP